MKTVTNFRSIRGKLLLLVLLTTLCAMFVAGAAILAYDIGAFREARITDMNIQTELLAYSTAPALQFQDTDVAAENLELLQIRPTIREAAIYNASGSLFASYVRSGVEPAFPVLPDAEGVNIEGDSLIIFKRIVENNEILGTAYMRSDYLLTERILYFVGILFTVALIAMAVSMLLSLRLQAMITKPLLAIVEIAHSVTSSRDYSQRAEKLSDDEVGTLVDAFNEMLDEIGASTEALRTSNAELELEIIERRRAREEVLQLNEELEQKVQKRTQQLLVTNQELESFCYSVSHDLRGPLRSISGFSQALLEELPPELPGQAQRYFDKITAATLRMGQLIEDLLNLSRVSRGELVRQEVNYTAMAEEVIQDLQQREPGRTVTVSIWEGIVVDADPKLLKIVLENLLGNAWKFTAHADSAKIETGVMLDGERQIYYVRDNGAGFDMTYADKLFGAFQRLHAMNEYPGTGIGLATVQRIVHRHGGRIWFNASPGHGAVFYFTLSHEFLPEENMTTSSQLKSV